MTLPVFIRSHLEPITAEWEAFARTLAPPASAPLSIDELRDHVPDLLRAIADDIENDRTAEASRQRSRGMGIDDAPDITRYSREHAATRMERGFNLQALGAEYRALRESVLRLWHDADAADGEQALRQQLRFSQAIDQAWTKAVAWYEQQFDQARDFMLGALGHDLRNPLGAVQMSARLLLQDPTLSGESAKAAMRVFNSSARMRDLVDQLLDFTRIRLGHRLPVNLVLCDLEHVLGDIADELRTHHPTAVLQVDCDGDLTGAWDGARIAQMLSNLIGNAIEHGTPGSPVTVFAESDADEVVVVIANKGPVIPGEQLQRMFEFPPVVDTESREAIAARRLGLMIAHEVVAAHGGRIDVTSSEESGTAFTIRLPKSPHPA